LDRVIREQRSENMRRVKSKDTRPEMIVRSQLHRMGYRFRLHRKDLPGKPDIVLPKWRVAIFVHGCFWHGCPRCDRGTRIPKTNRQFWIDKVAENRRRDDRTIEAIKSIGWRVFIIWECEIRNTTSLATILSDFLSQA
jgi:DNA mismatch endonuclease, patch repair protein